MNTILLKVNLLNTSISGTTEAAHTTIICKATAVKSILQRFFDCFNMPEATPWGYQFRISAYTAPIYDFNVGDNLQNVNEIDEDNPFNLDKYENNWIWHNVNERLYRKQVFA